MHRSLVLGTLLATFFAVAPQASAGGPDEDSASKASLDKDIIRRIVRAHINEIRSCYNLGLRDDPNLQGKVVTHFVIDPDGEINHAEVQSTTLDHEDVEECMIGAIAHWKFPKPKGEGNVMVTYPFVLEPG